MLTVLGDTSEFSGVSFFLGSGRIRLTVFFVGKLLEVFMRPVSRHSVSKGSSSGKFRRQSSRTKAANIAPPPMRGGYRL